MKTKSLFLALVALLIGLCPLAGALSFDDIEFWVGEGSNQAGLVIDWNDGKNPQSLMWGFRWDGAAKGETMFRAIVAADPRLYANSSGGAVFGLGYDLDDDGVFGVNPALTFIDGWATGSPNDNRLPTDIDDHWKEGWMSAGYWSYWLRSSSTANWGFSGTGMGGRTLSNGVWDGWSWAPAPSWSGGAPSTPEAAAIPVSSTVIPEPATLTLLGIGLAGAAWSHAKRRRLHA